MSKFLEQDNTESDSFFINRKIHSEKLTKELIHDDIFIENQNLSKQLLERGVSEKDIKSLLEKQAKVKNILKIIDDNEKLIKNINSYLEKDLSDFKLEVDVSDDALALKAIKHIFKKNTDKITYEMYLYAKNRLNILYKTKIEDGLNE